MSMGESLLALGQSLAIEYQINWEGCSVVRCVSVGRRVWKYERPFLLSSMVSHFCIPPSCCTHSDFLAKAFLVAVHCSENCKLTSCHHSDNTPSVAHPTLSANSHPQMTTRSWSCTSKVLSSCPTCLRLEARWLVAILAASILYKPLSPPKGKNIIFFHGALLSICLTGEDID